MSEFERQGYEIARQHLESSFNIEKSIGLLKWKQKQEQNQEQNQEQKQEQQES